MANRTVGKLKSQLLQANVRIAQLEQTLKKEASGYRKRLIDAAGREDDLKLTAAELAAENERLRAQIVGLVQEQEAAIQAGAAEPVESVDVTVRPYPGEKS